MKNRRLESVLWFMIESLNAKRQIRRKLNWLIEILVYIQSAVLWFSKVDFVDFASILFFVRKQSKHPTVSERAIEYLWVCARLRDLRAGQILDVGCKEGLPTTEILRRWNFVYGIEPNISEQISGENYCILPGDIRSTEFPDCSMDAVVAISTLEHIGVAGRYGVTENDETGDYRAAAEIHRILKRGGGFYGSVPFGRGTSRPLNRLYDAGRLLGVLTGFQLVDLAYFKYYEEYGLWLEVDASAAELNDWDTEPWYSLACFFARKSGQHELSPASTHDLS